MAVLNAPANVDFSDAGGQSDVRRVLSLLQAHPGIHNNIVCWKSIPAAPPRYGAFPSGLSPRIIEALAARGIGQLYTHQAQALSHALAGRHQIIVTPTASGKTLCYNLPVLQALLDNPRSRALYLFPTKALAQDQMLECHELARKLDCGIKVYTYDGDTPASARRAIRSAGQIVVTNPDMLHCGILPHHTSWIQLFENLRYVVIDEIHHYRGVFGAHVANVLRRLRRVAKFYGASPVFICCSATIANPRELALALTGEQLQLVDDNGAPRGEKAFIFYNPPVVNAELGIRRSVLGETRRLAARFLRHGVQTIVFARSRLRVEILTTYLKRAMKRLGGDPERIKGYRGGYLPLERRAIEQGVKNGEVLGVVSTNALELGIDIGRLKAAILAGYPGGVASAWQQAGRAGRSTEAAVAILVASSAPLDQFLMHHPDYFFGAAPEAAIVNPDNLIILSSHLKCGAFELPFEQGELFGSHNPLPLLQHLEREKLLRQSGGRWYWANEAFPAEGVSLRTPTVENFVVIDASSRERRVLAEIDFDSAPFFIHEDAIYIHQSQTWFIERLDWDGRTAYAKRVDVDYYTDAQAHTGIRVLQRDYQEDLSGGSILAPSDSSESETHAQPVPSGRGRDALSTMPRDSEIGMESKSGLVLDAPARSRNFGDVTVQTLVAKYKKIKFETHENVGWGEIQLPENEMQTESYWLTLRPELKDELALRQLDLAAGLRSLANALANAVPLHALCDPRDFAVVPMVRAPFDQCPTIYIYDRYPGGIGLARRIYSIDRDVLHSALQILADCPCASGCPSCAGPALEAGEQGKKTAQVLLRDILRQMTSNH